MGSATKLFPFPGIELSNLALYHLMYAEFIFVDPKTFMSPLAKGPSISSFNSKEESAETFLFPFLHQPLGGKKSPREISSFTDANFATHLGTNVVRGRVSFDFK